MSAVTAAMSLQMIGLGTSSIGSYFSAKQQQTALEYQASIAETNARLSELGAESELFRGQREEGAARLRTSHIKSAQRVALAANGVDLGEGNAAEVLTSTDYMGEVDANTIAANAVRSAWGYRTQAVSARNEALMKRTTADSISPIGAAAGTLLSGAGQVAGNWYSMNKAGAAGGK